MIWRSHRPFRSGSSGFTLIELAIVLFIIAIMAGITIPRLRSLTGAQLRSTAQRMSNTIRYLSEEAALRRTTYALQLDLDGQAYAVARLDPVEGRFVRESGVLAKEVRLPPGVRILDVVHPSLGKLEQGVVPTHFYPEGFADRAVIHLVDDRDYAYTIRVNPVRGIGEVFQGYQEFESASTGVP